MLPRRVAEDDVVDQIRKKEMEVKRKILNLIVHGRGHFSVSLGISYVF